MPRARIVAFWSELDVVLTPTLALPPVPIGWQDEGVDGALEQLRRNTLFTPFTAIANLTGLPAMSLPLHGAEDGCRSASQAIGPPAGEATCSGSQLSSRWHDRGRPGGRRSPARRQPASGTILMLLAGRPRAASEAALPREIATDMLR